MPAEPCPPVLYKYYPPERINIFDNWTVRFTNPANFNDAFDTNWAVRGKEQIRERQKFRSHLGIFSLSRHGDSHLMWVHYADQHRGFVVGFKTSASFLHEGDSELRNVQYGVHPPQIMPVSNDWCWYKDSDWEYEHEWRCVRKIELGKPRDIAFSPDDIGEIIIGAQMTDTDINSILNFVEAMNTVDTDIAADDKARLSLRRAKPDISSRTIQIDACGLSLCSRCSGHGHVNE
jgi:hypothetical protein